MELESIKSEKALEFIEHNKEIVSIYESDYCMMDYENVIELTKITEQDTTNKFMRKFEEFMNDWKDMPVSNYMIDEFKNFINS